MKKRVTFTLEEELLKELKAVSASSMIPQSRLVEKAITAVIKEQKQKSKEE